jgi:hypothetical protein
MGVFPNENATARQFRDTQQQGKCSSYLKIMAWSLLTFFGVMFIPFIGLVGAVGLLFVTYALPVLCVRWWIKYGAIHTSDVDFLRARLTAILISCLAALNLLRDLPIRLLYLAADH